MAEDKPTGKGSAAEEPGIEKEAGDEEKKSKISKAVDFITGKDEEEKSQKAEDKKAGKQSFFNFLRSNWRSSDEAKGFVGKLGDIYTSYQNLKEKESENLQTYEAISLSARLSPEFLVLTIGSCLVATFGLFQNSTAVIIGAMLIAPLMMPILGLALATVWGDQRLLWRSFITLAIGSLICLVISAGITYLIPAVEFNSEIRARINPNLYDILVALASGLIGAYAYVNPNISSSISGVAIAVALMPPICTVGIALGLNDIRATLGAALLYMTNLVGISLSASLVFWRLRVHPTDQSDEEVEVRAKKNVLLAAFLLVVIAVPLGYFMWESFIIKKRQVEVSQILTEEIKDSEILNLKVKKYPRIYTVTAWLAAPPDKLKVNLEAVKKKISALFNNKAQIKLVTLPMSVQAAAPPVGEEGDTGKEVEKENQLKGSAPVETK